MKLEKYQKEYDRFNRITQKAYSILINLYQKVSNDEKLQKNKDMSFILKILNSYISSFFDILDDINNVDFTKVKDVKSEKLNNLLILPLYEDIDIYVPVDSKIGDIFNTTKE